MSALVVAALSYLLNKNLANHNSKLTGDVQSKLDSDRKKHSADLAKINADLTRTVQSQLDDERSSRAELLEHIKRDLQETLASRTRRAEYLKSQITNLYGPLVFLLEICHIRMEASETVDHAVQELSKLGPDYPYALNADEIGAWQDTTIRYGKLIFENTDDAIKLLHAGWGWLDENDYATIIPLIRDVERGKAEFRTGPRRLPQKLYSNIALPRGTLDTPKVVKPEVVSHFRQRLLHKQRELSGLTEASKPQGRDAPATKDQSAPNRTTEQGAA